MIRYPPTIPIIISIFAIVGRFSAARFLDLKYKKNHQAYQAGYSSNIQAFQIIPIHGQNLNPQPSTFNLQTHYPNIPTHGHNLHGHNLQYQTYSVTQNRKIGRKSKFCIFLHTIGHIFHIYAIQTGNWWLPSS